MIVSDKHNFVFFHVYKVAGTSIRKVLEPLSTFIHPFGHFKPCDFRTMKMEDGRTGQEIMDEFFTFAFVRNPWDWHISLFHYMKNPCHPNHKLIKDMSFEEYVTWYINEDRKTQYQLISINKDNSSPIELDYIGHFETIEDDFKYVCDTLNVSCELPHENKAHHSREHYSTYYNNVTKEKILNCNRKDVEYFEYEF